VLTSLVERQADGKNVVPIIPDESAYFGMEVLVSVKGGYLFNTGQKIHPT